jgi:NitT/TauT family transport system permease protein
MSQSASSTSAESLTVQTESARMAGLVSRRVVVYAARIAVVLFLAIVWELACTYRMVDERFVGRPSGVLSALYQILTGPSIWKHAGSTIEATALAFVIGSVSGVICGLALAAWPLLDEILDPIIVALNSVPRVALAPLFILWFGIGLQSKVVAGVSLVFFILLITTRSGLKNADPDLLLMTRTLCATKLQTFKTVVVHISVPSIFAGLELAAVYSLLGVVVSEMIASNAGLGVVVAQYAQTFAINETFAVLTILGVLSALLTRSVQLLEAHFLKWKQG